MTRHAPEVRADRLHLRDQRWAVRHVGREPAALVGALVAGLPEAAAVELAVGGRERREVRVASALPVHVLEVEVLVLGDGGREVAEHHVTAVGEYVEPRVGCVERDVGRPVRRLEPVFRDGHRASVGTHPFEYAPRPANIPRCHRAGVSTAARG